MASESEANLVEGNLSDKFSFQLLSMLYPVFLSTIFDFLNYFYFFNKFTILYLEFMQAHFKLIIMPMITFDSERD